MATTWLLVMTAVASVHATTALSDGGYKSQALCERTGANVVERLNQREKEMQQANTRVSADGLNTSVAYTARKWRFECLPTEKE